jgi:hypothetical protein
MKPLAHRLTAASLLLASMVIAAPASAAVANLTSIQDNTIFSELTGNSNALGDGIYAGRNNVGGLRRGLVKFDLTSVPAGSQVLSVTVTLEMIQSSGGNEPVSLHRLTASWGEGTSSGAGQGAAATTGDATWIRRFFNTTSWTTSGGDFIASASATQNVDGPGSYAWTGGTLVNDVQGWVNAPSSNHGWIVIGNEAVNQSAKKFASREGAPDPALQVVYRTPAPAAAPIGLGLVSLAIAALSGRALARRRRA